MMDLGGHPFLWVRTQPHPMGVLCCTASPWLYEHTQVSLGVRGKKEDNSPERGRWSR
jgi:hypothetical protein